MFNNYLKSLWRYVARNKGFTFINVSGLAIGMLACMLIAQFVLHELSYDNFLENNDRIFRLQLDRYNKGEITTRWAAGAAGIGPDLKANFPEVEEYVRLHRRTSVLAVGDIFFKEENIFAASEGFFKVFSVRLISGIDSTALKAPFTIVLSQTLARKYFGNADPVGKTIRSNGRRDYHVTGVFEDIPANSHMEIDALVSFSSLVKAWNDPITSWQWDGFLTYIKLRPHVDPKSFEGKLPAYVERKESENLKPYNAAMVFNLQPVTDIHLDSDYMMEFKANGSRQSVSFLIVVAILILAIAWINYINLSTAKSVERAREVGVRKVMGGFRSQLVQQFLTESMMLNFIAISIAVVGVLLLTPWFSDLTGRQLGYGLFSQPVFWGALVTVISAGALISGLYPAFILSSFRPAEVLKGKFKNSGKGTWLRKSMVIVQFVASITLIAGTFAVYSQLKFMRSQALGFNVEQTVVINSPLINDSTQVQKYQTFKNLISENAEVTSVTAASAVPGSQPDWNAGGIRRLSQSPDEANQYRVIEMDDAYIDAFGLSVIAGRSFSNAMPNERKSVILNASGARLMGFAKPEDAIDDMINFWGDTLKIVGVVKDYHQESLKKAFEPLIFRYFEAPNGYYSIKFNTTNAKSSISKFESEWKSVFPGNPFHYFFLDSHYDQQYRADRQFGNVFGIFSCLAIFIACLGLFGLSSLTALQRSKEIGIRKVLGASVPGLLGLISKEFINLVVVAIVLSVPLGAWMINSWLQAFAYRIPLSWWLFALPGLCVTVIALLTISLQTVKAAMANPVKSLRSE